MPVPEDTRVSVVLADDSPELRTVVARALEASGHFRVVGHATDGDEALQVVGDTEPAVLLIDVSMPSVDGLEALPWITASYPDVAVVVFTGFEDDELVARARDLGATDVVEKSIPLQELPRRLLRVLGEVRPDVDAPARRLRVVRGQTETDDPEDAADGQLVLDEHIQQFRQLFDRATIGMATMTVRGTIVRANQALAALMSCAPRDLVGVDYGRLTSGAGDHLDRALEAVLSGRDDLAVFEHVLPAARPQARPRHARVSLAAIRDSGDRVLYVYAQVQDVTAQRRAEDGLRRSEETFRLLVSAVADYAVFMLDAEGRVISWNAGAEQIKGYRADEVVGQSLEIFYPPEEREAGRPQANLRTALEQGSFAEEAWRVRKDGTMFWASVVIRPVRDDEGRLIGYAKVTRDRTAQRAQEQWHEQVVAEQAHLLAVSAHELRTPTAVIDGSVSLLQASWDEMDADERDELLDSIRSSGQRVGRLASDLATVSAQHRQGLELRPEAVSLTQVVRLAVARARALHPSAQVVADVPDEVVVVADESRLGQAIDNLLENAVRHGGGSVTVTMVRDPEVVRIRVANAGDAVSPDLVPRLFQRFARGETSTGSGLGLALVREIARAHGGEVTYLPPAEGAPTAFELSLPTSRRTREDRDQQSG